MVLVINTSLLKFSFDIQTTSSPIFFVGDSGAKRRGAHSRETVACEQALHFELWAKRAALELGSVSIRRSLDASAIPSEPTPERASEFPDPHSPRVSFSLPLARDLSWHPVQLQTKHFFFRKYLYTFICRACNVWNNLDVNLKACSLVRGFKNLMKDRLHLDSNLSLI